MNLPSVSLKNLDPSVRIIIVQYSSLKLDTAKIQDLSKI